MTDEKQEYIEEVALYFEKVGLMRMAGRIIGWLLICEPPQQSMPQLCEALQASKSSISVAVRQLLQLYLIERVSLPGDRRDYYRASDDMWTRSFRSRMHQLVELRELAERGLRLLQHEGEDKRYRRLELMRDMNDFMAREFLKLLEQWEIEKKARGI